MFFKILQSWSFHSLRQCVPVLHCLTFGKLFLMVKIISLTAVSPLLLVCFLEARKNCYFIVENFFFAYFKTVLLILWVLSKLYQSSSPSFSLPSYVIFPKPVIIQDTIWALFSEGVRSFFRYFVQQKQHSTPAEAIWVINRMSFSTVLHIMFGLLFFMFMHFICYSCTGV